jgi:hypothetical protein
MVFLGGNIMEKKLAKIVLAILLVFLFLCFGGLAKATIVQLDLLSLGCPTGFDYDSPPYWWQANFDLGVTFSEISHVYIDWSGGITAGLVRNVNPVTQQPVGEPFPIGVGAYASLGANPYLRRTEVWGGGATYPAPESFDLTSEMELLFSSTWSDLLDGQGRIGIGYTEPISADGGYGYTQHGSITLNSATLVVDGTVIPEPASLLLLAFGALGPRLIRPKRRVQ